MKIAVCISGQPRFYDLGYKTLKKNLIDANPNCYFDFYLHGWWNEKNIGKGYDASSWNIGKSDIVQENMVEKLVNLYNPKKILLEPEPKITFDDRSIYNEVLTDATPEITFSMFTTIYRSFMIVPPQKYYRYDYIIRTRYDINLKDPLIIEGISPKKLWYSPVLHNPKQNWPCDWLNIGSPNVMEKYFLTIDSIDGLVKRKKIPLCGERMIRGQMEKYQIGFQKANPVVNMELIRSR